MNISIKNLKKEFFSIRGKVAVLDGVDLEVEEGEFFVLLGPSGCGKSTLLNLIAGLERPTSGEIRYGGTVMAGPGAFTGPRGRNVAMVFQSYALYPHLSVFGNVAFPLRIAKTPAPEIKERVEKAAAMLGITPLLGSKPGELSGGERQRVAIARAVVRRPDVLLFDEPLSNLDAQLRLATRVQLKKLQRELGITSIYVTHDQVEAMTLGDRVAVLKGGRLQQLDTPMGLYERPANRFVAQFIGSPPMNLAEGALEETPEGYAASAGGVRLALLKDPALKAGPAGIGIRPSDIEVSREPAPGTTPVRIDSAEPLGRDILLSFSLAGAEFSALTADKDLKEGASAHARLIPEKIHVFY